MEVPRCTSYGFDYEEHRSVRAIKEQQESNHTLLFTFSFSHKLDQQLLNLMDFVRHHIAFT